jgi:hypothetical protein
MFGNINKNNKNFNYKSDLSENSQSSRIRTSRPTNRPVYTNRSRRYEEATYSVSSEEDSEESQRPIRKLKRDNVINHNETPRIDESEFIKKENIELKLKNEYLTKLNNLSESILKTTNLILDVSNEQKSINARLDKLENESKDRSDLESINSKLENNLKNELMIVNQIADIKHKLKKLEDVSKNKITDIKQINEVDILPIGDNSSVDTSATSSTNLLVEANKSDDILPKLPKIEKK